MAVTNWRIAHWSRWRTFHMPASSFGTRAAMNLFWIWYWHIPLAMGRTLVITPSEHNIDVLSLLAYIEAKGATYIDCLTPSQMQLIAELADTLPPSLIHICSSGEALPLATAYVPRRRRSSSAMPFTLPPSHLSRAPGAIHPVLRSHLTQPPRAAALASVRSPHPAPAALPLSESSDASGVPSCASFLHVHVHNILATTETAADICLLKDLSLPSVEQPLSAGRTHAPILDSSASRYGGIVWNNQIARRNVVASSSRDGIRSVGIFWAATLPHSCSWTPSSTTRRAPPPIQQLTMPSGGASPPGGRTTRNAFTSNDRAAWAGSLLMIVGRTDSVVKVRGFRVDLAGVEAQLLECPHLLEGVVLAHDDTLWALVVSADLDSVRAFVTATFEPSTRPSC